MRAWTIGLCSNVDYLIWVIIVPIGLDIGLFFDCIVHDDPSYIL